MAIIWMYSTEYGFWIMVTYFKFLNSNPAALAATQCDSSGGFYQGRNDNEWHDDVYLRYLILRLYWEDATITLGITGLSGNLKEMTIIQKPYDLPYISLLWHLD